MKTLLFVASCLIATPLYAQSTYPPSIKDARVETYRKINSTELKLWIFGETDTNAPKPAIVFFFGGGWNTGSPDQFEKQARHFAKRGMIAITPDYRVKSRNKVQVVDCVKDAKAAIAWVRDNASRLGIDPDKIAASGGSAGGHLAASTGTISGFGSDERPNAMILFNPACTLAPIADFQPRGANALLKDERLGGKLRAMSPAHHIGPHTPPTLILHGKKDTTVPYASVVAFQSVMEKANRPCKLIGYEGAGHGFFNRGEDYHKTLAEADAFLVDLGWIKSHDAEIRVPVHMFEQTAATEVRATSDTRLCFQRLGRFPASGSGVVNVPMAVLTAEFSANVVANSSLTNQLRLARPKAWTSPRLGPPNVEEYTDHYVGNPVLIEVVDLESNQLARVLGTRRSHHDLLPGCGGASNDIERVPSERTEAGSYLAAMTLA